MAWTPRFPNMDFGLPILDNLERIFKRDQVEALTWANGGTAMASFERVLQCERVSDKYPSLAIFPIADNPTLSEEEVFVDQELRVSVEIACSSTKPNDLARELMKRVNAVRQMVLTADEDDLLLDVGTPHGPVELQLGRAVYEQVREHETKKGLYYRSAFVTFTFKFNQA